MGLGLQAAYGADALQQNLRQRLMDQIAAQQRAQALTQQGFENDLKTKQFQSGEELKQAQLKALIENRAAEEADRQNAGDLKLADTVPAGTTLAPTSPIAGRLQRIGLAQPNMTLTSTQTGGGIALPADPNATPDAAAAPITGTLRSVQSPSALRDYTKLASAKQQETQDAADARVEAARVAAENRGNENDQRGKDRLMQIAAAAATRPAKDTTASDNARLDKSYQFNSTQLNKVSQPLEDKQANIAKAVDALAQRTPASDAIVVPQILSAMAGGAGSGLRMNEAEIKRIFGGRSGWENIKASIEHWNPNAGQALQITDAQRQQLGQLLQTAHGKLSKKLDAVHQAAQDLVDAEDVNQHRQIVTSAKQRLDAIDGGDDTSGGPKAGDTKTFPNGAKAVYDGTGWVKQ